MLDFLDPTIQFVAELSWWVYPIAYLVAGIIWGLVDIPLYCKRQLASYRKWKEGIISPSKDVSGLIRKHKENKNTAEVSPERFAKLARQNYTLLNVSNNFFADVFFWPVLAPYFLLTDVVIDLVRNFFKYADRAIKAIRHSLRFINDNIIQPLWRGMKQIYEELYGVVFHIYNAIIKFGNRRAIADFEKIKAAKSGETEK